MARGAFALASKRLAGMDGSTFSPLRPNKTLVVVGNGMVGHRFVESAAERGLLAAFHIVVISEETRLAYDRVNLSKWFDGKGESELALTSDEQYAQLGVEVSKGDPV